MACMQLMNIESSNRYSTIPVTEFLPLPFTTKSHWVWSWKGGDVGHIFLIIEGYNDISEWGGVECTNLVPVMESFQIGQ